MSQEHGREARALPRSPLAPERSLLRCSFSAGQASRDAALRQAAVRRVTDTLERLIDTLVVLADPVDPARILGRRDIAVELARESHLLLDLLHRGHALTLAPPEVVLDSDAHMQSHGDGHGVER